MLLVAGAALVGVLLGILMVQNIEAGETWEDWQSAIGGTWFNVGQYGLIALFLAGIIVQGQVGALLIAIPCGACAVFFTIGIRRRVRARHEPRIEEPLDEELLYEDPPESWRSKALWFSGTLVIALVVLYIAGLRGIELLAVSVFALVVVIVSEKLGDRVAAWIRR